MRKYYDKICNIFLNYLLFNDIQNVKNNKSK